ncbi:hypothetical protein [Halopenitus persicus]|uniref:Uncharacterized protein n=1 Tax=Halopenitus persicus TaxID=1048396 RepID=A0A1H3JJK1_9EURY|nr:hypothetical protein [Halopenitus persicus]SDY39598.1 hypothetical protein SAMN05216564_10521 [Halopenitus persicus]
MARSTLGQSLTPALAAWRELVAEGPTGPGIDFSETNRTRRCRRRCDAFLADPSPETFRELWSADTMASYWAPNAAVLLGPDDAIDALRDVCSEMIAAEEFDPTWTDRLAGSGAAWGVTELYARLQGGTEPIPTLEAQAALRSLRDASVETPAAVAAAIADFAQDYESAVGHASAGTAYELPRYAEIDEFFRLVQTTDRETIAAHVTGPYAALFRPLIGHRVHTGGADPIEWQGVDALIEAHVDARDSGAYDDLETAHWGGTHIESWKWQFADYFETVIRADFDPTALTAADVPRFLAAIEEPDAEFDAVSNVPAKMMGGQFHRLTWQDIVAHCRENPAEAAAVLSDLYDETLPIVDRLNEFHECFRHLTTRDENDRSPGSLLRAATALLMYAYPERHITFQYQRMDAFFADYSTLDGLDDGFNARQYREVAIACRDLASRIEDRAGDASLIDVQTLVYIADDA